MSEKREQIQAKIQKNKDSIAKLKKENSDLYYESLLLSDDEQQYIEEVQTRIVSKRPKITKEVLVGMVRWDEDFRDEGTGEVITIQRHRIVKEDGEWVV